MNFEGAWRARVAKAAESIGRIRLIAVTNHLRVPQRAPRWGAAIRGIATLGGARRLASPKATDLEAVGLAEQEASGCCS